MSDVPTIDFNDAIRYFINVAPGSCPFCSTNNWTIGIQEQDNTKCYVSPLGFNRLGEPAYKVDVECVECGFIRAHLTRQLMKWIDSHPDDGEG